ncbi:E3 ubiquitin-protein ligase TRIM38-like [Octodon degus]|uniref:E3 ubiquitin-protein ligase TRIM38-like n=1 Tax=Octodon degus TaxID=10160 RepID=A0A6P6D6S1_OCTDE|nr:E3 ubiquitin-protein ligase TRIM38-like [Octodon degus]
MASAAPLKEIQEIATCFLCSKLLSCPLSLYCGHSYCMMCMWTFCRQDGLPEEFLCPQCQGPIDINSWRHNKHLERIIAVLEQMEEMQCELKCEEHGEPLQLFCEDDKQRICRRCEQAPEHQGHTIVLVKDACQGYMEKLQKAVTRKMERLRHLYTEYMNQKTSIRTQIMKCRSAGTPHLLALMTLQKQKVKLDFEILHTFLREEEKLWIWRLDNEEEKMLRRLGENEANLQKRDQDVEGTLSRASAVKLEASEALSLEVPTTCDVAKLYLDVKAMLRRHQVSVTLDPDTAHLALTLSEDRRQVSYQCSQPFLKALFRRFAILPCVLGCERFSSGRHYFEVDVGEGTAWDVGVCMENVQRGFDMKQEPESGFWAIRLCTENGYVALTSPPTALELRERPRVVGVALDHEAGAVSFYSMTSGSHIFTFPKASFSGTLRPFLNVYEHSPLFLPPPKEF